MGTLSIVSVMTNVLVLPAVPIAMLLTFLTGVVGSIASGLGTFLGIGAHGVLTYIILVAEALSTLPLAEVRIPVFPWWLMALLFACILIGTAILQARWGSGAFNTASRTFSDDHDALPVTEKESDVYADWTIEEERDAEGDSQALRTSRSNDSFPFR
jgi:competence protein ComEC